MRIRQAWPGEAGELSALALRSKGYWGYDEAFLAACREELSLADDGLAERRAVVAEGEDGGLLGLATLEGEPPHGELGMLFVDPPAIGRGVGRALFRQVAETARATGFQRLSIDADPNAEPFYLAMGAVRVGEVPSGSVPGRLLPLLEYRLTEDQVTMSDGVLPSR
jgi:GNAT superfamily N-acetyltransferase